jgi:hypothetical protein
MSKLNDMLRKVQALLDRAEHPNTPAAEAESARNMAERLMLKYRIEEEEVRTHALASDATAIKPIVEPFVVGDAQSEYRNHYYTMMSAIISHVGNIRYANDIAKAWDADGRAYWQDTVTLVGFEWVVRWAMTLYTSLRLHFSNTLEPKVDPTLSDEDNIYRLRAAGIERIRIADMMGWGTSQPATARVTNLYKRACAARGESASVTGRSLNVKTYRSSFADAYVSEVRSRLSAMRIDAGLASGALVLSGRKEAVDEAFYDAFPNLRPKPAVERVGGNSPWKCEKCRRAKSGYCRDHSYLKPRAYKERKYSSTGLAAGRRAGATADLGHTTKKIGE